MPIKYIDEIQLTNKRVFIRVDFNVPLNAEDQVADDTRIKASLSTIQYALKHKAIIILASHLGRPQGERNAKYSLAPVAERLMELLELPSVIFPEDCIGDGIKKLSLEMKPGQVMMLENLRFHKEEEENDENFAKKLASLCDVYINDAFGTAHRAHASTVGMVKFAKEKGAGFLMKKEIEFLNKIVLNPAHPFVAILGGAKVSDKIDVLSNLLNKVDSLSIGGAMAYTFLAALGAKVGNSKIEKEKIFLAKKALERAKTKGIPILLPVDHMIAQSLDANAPTKITEGTDIPEGWMGVDIGPKTADLFSKSLEKAKTIFWNGPLGVYEIDKFAQGTYSVARATASMKGVKIVGGGDSVSAIIHAGLESKITHISTGGGASLEFIEGKKLPGLKALS
ncbi:MAG: phosphoglycerate kinase [Deltaproteobacteria bacterium]|nr:phosphoglycerate kinase [Deltaproteobacteria bacterium]